LDVLSGAARSGFLLDSAIAGPFGQEKIEVETLSCDSVLYTELGNSPRSGAESSSGGI
jgi:hypothetical protein